MTSTTTDPWSPQYRSTTFTSLSESQTALSPSRYSYTDSHRPSSDGDDNTSTGQMRRITVSPSPSRQNSDSYSDDNSLEEVEATLNNLDDEFDDTEQALTQWSHGSSGPSYTSGTGSYTGTGTYTGYTGSPSFLSLPTFTPRTGPASTIDPHARLSKITERTEESRPSSGSFSAPGAPRPTNPTPDAFRRSGHLAAASSAHSRSSTDPGSERDLPPPGRTTELIARFETNSPAGGHSRTASAPGARVSSPFTASQSTPNLPTTTGYGSTTGYGYGSTYGYSSRPSSPTKSRSGGSSGSYTDTRPSASSLLSPPSRPPTSTAGDMTFRSTTPGGTHLGTGSYLSSATYTQTPSAFSTNAYTGTYADTNTGTRTETGTGTGSYSGTFTGTNTLTTPTSTLRRPQTSPRSPLASVRNIVALWKERTPSAARSGKSSAPGSATSVSPPPDGEGLFGIRRRAQRVGARLREREGGNGGSAPATPSRRGPEATGSRGVGEGKLPPGFDVAELAPYTQSHEAPLHIGLLWYLNVHATPPYRWQRCQALLYPHMLLLSWLAPGGGRGIVALDLLNCTNVQSAPSPTHPSAREDVGTIAARQQSGERGGQPLMDMLVPFHMLYADGVERLAAESLLERQKWVNRIWEAVNRPIALPDSSSVTRSPSITGSIATIMSYDSRSSESSNGSRSTVFVPPIGSLPSISDFNSNASSGSYKSVSRGSSLVSSHHTRTVDDTVISNQQYVYPGDSRAIQRGNSLLRRSGSMTDLDEEFSSALDRARGARPGLGFPSLVLGGSPVTVSSGPNLGRNVRMTPPPSTGRGSDRARSEVSDEAFFSAGSASGSSGARSSYYSTTFTTEPRTLTGSRTDTTSYGLDSSSGTEIVPSTLSYRRTESGSYLGDSAHDSGSYTAASPSSLSRSGGVRRRVYSTRSYSSGYPTEDSDKENTSETYTPSCGSHTIESGSYGTGSYTSDSRSCTDDRSSGPSGSSGSDTYSGSCTGGGSFTPGDETGYDVCPSSDLTDLTCRPTSSSEDYSSTPVSSSPPSEGSAPESENFITASQESSEYITARSPSLRGSIISSASSYKSLPTIPSESEYLTADTGVSHYRTISEPSAGSEYITAEIAPSELEEIPSEHTPTLSSIKLDSEDGSVLNLPPLPSAPPSVVPSIKSPSVLSDVFDLPPLPPSAPPSIVSDERSPYLAPSAPPSVTSAPRSPSLAPSIGRSPSLVASARSVSSVTFSISSPSTVDLPPLPPSLPPLSPRPASLTTTEESEERPGTATPTPTATSARYSQSLPPSYVSSSIPSVSVSESVLSSTSDVTPSTFALSSSPTPSEHPSTPAPRPPSVSTPTSISISTIGDFTPFTPTQSSHPPPSPQSWAQETDASYESSQLHPSPSVRSLAIPEGPDTSFETSFLRPSGSVISSADRLSTIPETPTPSPSLLPPSPLAPLTPVSALPSSASPSSDALTPSSMSSFSTETSVSLVRTLSSSSSSSFLSQSSISSSVFEPSLLDEPVHRTERSPSTVPSLLTTPVQSSRGLRSPIPLPSASVLTPEGSIIVSLTTPQGTTRSEQPSLRTDISSESEVTQPDFCRDLSRLADDLHRYHEVRGEETRAIAGNVQALRNELRDLSEFLRRTPSPPPSPIYARPPPPTQPVPRSPSQPQVPQQIPQPVLPPEVEHVDRSAGGSTILSSFGDHGLTVLSGQLTRATSSASSIGSFLSSHHSDDDLLASESYPDSPMPPWPSPLIPESDDSSIFTESSSYDSGPYHESSGSSSLPPLPPPSPSPSSSTSAITVRPLPPPPDLLEPLNVIRDQMNVLRDQLSALWDGQTSTNHMLDELRDRRIPQPDNRELTDRLHRIEDLLQALLSQGSQGPREPMIVPQPTAPTESESVADSDTLSRLAFVLRGFDSEHEMPAPVPARARGLSLVQQLDEILATSLPPVVAEHPPRLVPFVYMPERGARPRSASPVYISIPPRPETAPPFHVPSGHSRRPQRPPRRPPVVDPAPPRIPQVQEQPSEPPVIPGGPPREPTGEGDIDMLRAVQAERRRRYPDTDGTFRPAPPAPIISTEPRRSQTAPIPDGGSWYLPTAVPQPPQIVPPPPQIDSQPPRRRPTPQPTRLQYLPMPPGPTVVQLPPMFDNIMDVLRENRLAQLATVDQQRELMRYMRGLNEWLERDVHDRQSELRGVVARVDQLREDIRGMRQTVRPVESDDSSSTESDSSSGQGYLPPHLRPPEPFQPQVAMPEPNIRMPEPNIPNIGMPEPNIRMPEPNIRMPEPEHYPPGFVPTGQGPVIPGGGRATPDLGFRPVIPGGGHATPDLGFRPVIPGVGRATPGPGFHPVIPPEFIDHQHPSHIPVIPGVSMPGPMPGQFAGHRPPSAPGDIPFIPPALSRSGSRTPPFVPYRPQPPPVILMTGSESSTVSSSDHGRHPSRSSRTRTSSRDRRTPRPTHSSPGSSRSSTPPTQVIVPGQVMPGQVMPGQGMPGQIMPGQGMPGQIMPGQVMPGQVMPEVIHQVPGVTIVSPSRHSSRSSAGHQQQQQPQQPTIIIQQPGSQFQQPQMQQPLPGGMIPPLQMAPTTMHLPGQGPPQHIVVQQEPSYSSGSSSPSRRSRSRPSSRPSRRTRSSSSSGAYSQILPVPVGPISGGPVIIRSRSPSPRSSGSRRSRRSRRSRTPPPVPVPTPAITVLPQPPFLPPTQQTAMPPSQQGPVVLIRSSSGSRTRRTRSSRRSPSPSRYTAPMVVQPIPPPTGPIVMARSARSSRSRTPSRDPRPSSPQPSVHVDVHPPVAVAEDPLRGHLRRPRSYSRSPSPPRRPRGTRYDDPWDEYPRYPHRRPSYDYSAGPSRRRPSYSSGEHYTRRYSPRPGSRSPHRSPHGPERRGGRGRRSYSRGPEYSSRSSTSPQPHPYRGGSRPYRGRRAASYSEDRTPSPRRHGRRESGGTYRPEEFPDRPDRRDPRYRPEEFPDRPDRRDPRYSPGEYPDRPDRRDPRYSPGEYPDRQDRQEPSLPLEEHPDRPGLQRTTSRPPTHTATPGYGDSGIPVPVPSSLHQEPLPTHLEDSHGPERLPSHLRTPRASHPTEYSESNGEDDEVRPAFEEHIPHVPIIHRPSTSRPGISRTPSRPPTEHPGTPRTERTRTERTRPSVTEGDRESPMLHEMEDDRRPMQPVEGLPLPVRLPPVQPHLSESSRPHTVTPFPVNLEDAERERERLERLEEAETHLQQVTLAAQEAEDMRELDFRRHEEDRDRLFQESQDRRDQEARERAEVIWHDLDSRLAALPPPPEPPVEPPVEPTPEPPGDLGQPPAEEDAGAGGDDVSVRASLQAASDHVRDVLDTVKAEREEFAREREAMNQERDRLLAEAAAERAQMDEEREARIRALADELAAVREELENEKQQRVTMEAEAREQESRALLERDEAIRSQLGDITNLVQDQRDACDRKKELMDARWEEKMGRRQEKDDKWREIQDIVRKIQDDVEGVKNQAEEARIERESKPGIESVIDELRRQNAEQRELLTNLSETWRADCERHHEETINSVRSTAQEQVPFNVQGYLDEFSKALATEVRMLLGEVGKLREERRALQHELGFLLCMKSKYGPGGEFDPDWKPPPPPPGAPGGPPPPEPPPEPPLPPELPQAKPGWRTIHPRPRRKKKEPAPPPAAPPPAQDPRHQIQSWLTWQPDPGFAPSPQAVESNLVVPEQSSPGLFGPRTPSGSMYEGRR